MNSHETWVINDINKDKLNDINDEINDINNNIIDHISFEARTEIFTNYPQYKNGNIPNFVFEQDQWKL